jgi:hypothetical protein
MAFKSNTDRKAMSARYDMDEALDMRTVKTIPNKNNDWDIFLVSGYAACKRDWYEYPIMRKFNDVSDCGKYYGMYNPADGGQLRYIEQSKFWTTVKERTHHRNLKASADAIGLHYWPALLTTGCDRRAFCIAEKILHDSVGHYYGDKNKEGERLRGGWDSKGDKGLSPWMVRKYWLLSGAKDCPKFRFLVKHHTVLGFKRIRKEHSITDVRRLFIGLQWLNSHSKMDEVRNEAGFSTKALICLGRLSPALRWAAIHGLDGETLVRIRHLNWQAVKQVQDKEVGRQFFVAARVKSRTTWWKQMKPFCAGINPTHVWKGAGMPDLMSLKLAMGTFKLLMEEQLSLTVDHKTVFSVVNDVLPALTLARLFGKDTKNMWAYIQTFIYVGDTTVVSKHIHDAGQCQLTDKYFSPVWGKLLLAKPTLVQKTRWFGVAEEHLGHAPKTLEEAVAALDVVYTPSDSLLDSLAENSRSKYLALIGHEKKCEMIPAPGGVNGVVAGNYVLKQLEVGDIRAPMAGLLTDCCQHLEGAASACAHMSYVSPYSAVWAVFKGDNMVAQSWVWRSSDYTTLVMDSVEALHGHRDNRTVADLFVSAARCVVGTLGVERVAVSKTEYGMTRSVRSAAVFVCDMALPKMADSVQYSDATPYLNILAGAVNTYADVPAVVAVDDTVPYDIGIDVNAEPEYDTGIVCHYPDCEVDVNPAATVCWACGRDITEWVEDEELDEAA